LWPDINGIKPKKIWANFSVQDLEAFGEGYYGFVFADPDGHKFNVFHM